MKLGKGILYFGDDPVGLPCESLSIGFTDDEFAQEVITTGVPARLEMSTTFTITSGEWTWNQVWLSAERVMQREPAAYWLIANTRMLGWIDVNGWTLPNGEIWLDGGSDEARTRDLRRDRPTL